MQPWHSVPGDHQRRSREETYRLYWDPVHQFGMLYPRATHPLETIPYYETEGRRYVTHRGAADNAMDSRPNPFAARLLMRIAWSQDRGAALSAEEVDGYCYRRPARILDVGCGRGDLLSQWRDLGHEVCGVEPDPIPRTAALEKGLDVHAGSCEDLPDAVRAREFDIIVAAHVLHHCIDPLLAITNLAERLSRNGRFICEVPNPECLGARWAGIAWRHLDIPRQANVFTLQSLTALIERACLRVEKVRWAHYLRQFSRDTIEWERSKYEFFKSRGASLESMPVRSSILSRYALLASTTFATPRFKYDALRIVACHR